MTNDELQQLVEIGRQAEQFLGYLKENPYFGQLLERIRMELMQQMYGLTTNDKDIFVILKAQMEILPEILGAVSGDILMAQDAWRKLEGEEEKSPIL